MSGPEDLQPYGHAQPPKPPSGGSAVLGFLLVMVLHVVWFFFPLGFLFLGVLQLVYVFPILLIALTNDKRRMAAGAGIAAGITLIAQGIFCGLVFTNSVNL